MGMASEFREFISKGNVMDLAVGVALNFVILAFIVFMMVKQVNRLKRSAPAAPAAPPPTAEDVLLLREIRDALKSPG